jgi:cation diffusion facilitator family transporter
VDQPERHSHEVRSHHDYDHHETGHGHGHEHEHANRHPHAEHGHTHPMGFAGFVGGFLHPHSHDAADSLDDALAGSTEGIRAVKVSLALLGGAAIVQMVVAVASGSVGLLADTVHNFADALTAIPLWLAFSLTRRAPTRRYTYGYGRAEDLAGVFVVLMIAGSAGVAAWESIERLLHPRPVTQLGWVALAAILGFLGNELVARLRIRAGERIGSAALAADGYHARTDGLTSLAVLVGAAGAWFGVHQLDAIVGLGITLAILLILKDAALQIWRRLMDGVDPAILDQAEAAARASDGVEDVTSIRARWIGHSIHAEALIVAQGKLTLREAHALGERARHAMLHAVPKLAGVTVHVDPSDDDGRDPHADLAHHDANAPVGLR